MAVDNLSKAPSDGTAFGQSAADKIAFYGTTPITQPTASAQTALTDSTGGTANPATGLAQNTATYNSAIVNNAIATIAAQTNAIRSALVNLGIIKGS